MAINKKLIHFNTFENFNSKKLSANKENTLYTIGVNGAIQTGSPDILYQSIVYIKDTKQQWTHGLLYSGSESSSECKNVYIFKYTGLSSITQEEWDAMLLANYINLLLDGFQIPANTYKTEKAVLFLITLDSLTKFLFKDDSDFIIIGIKKNLSIGLEKLHKADLGVYDTTQTAILNITNAQAIQSACINLTSNHESLTYIISDTDDTVNPGNTLYIDTSEMKLHLFHSAANAAVRLLFTNGEAYYYVEGFNIPLIGNIAAGWYSLSISKWITLPETPLKTARVGDFITLTKVDVPASDFYSKYIDFDSINLELDSGDRLAFNAYKSKLGLSSLSDGLFIKFLIVNGYINTCNTNPTKDPYAKLYPLAVEGMVTTYIAQITPNTENLYSGEFWTGNMTGPGIYSYITTGRPEGSEDGEFYTGYVSPDGTQTLVSMKDPSKVFTRPNIDELWVKVISSSGVGKNIGSTGEIFNDYINNKAHEDHAHAEGLKTNAYSYNAHAEGYNTQAGHNAHSEGSGTHALGQNSHAEGLNTLALGNNSHSEGDSTKTTNYNAHAEGYRTIASGNGAHAEGNSSDIADEKYWNVASGFASHTEGSGTRATNKASHAEGVSTSSEGQGSHSEGLSTRSTGTASHAEGTSTWASGNSTHAEGYYTTARNTGEHAEGTYNYPEINNLIHSVGIGRNTDNRVNAHAITLDGKHYIYGIGGYEGQGIKNATDLATAINSNKIAWSVLE